MSCQCSPYKSRCRQCASAVKNTKVKTCGCSVKNVCSSCSGKPVVKEISRVSGITTAVVDDANELTYLYGNIQHENYHQPAEECVPYVVVPSSWQTYKQLLAKTEVFEGEYVDNTVILEEEPVDHRHVFVFLNGVHQDEGQEFDYLRDGKNVAFRTHVLLPTDRVTVKYHYAGVEY